MPITVQHGTSLLGGYGRAMGRNARVKSQTEALDEFGRILSQGMQRGQELERQKEFAGFQDKLFGERELARDERQSGYAAEENRMRYLRNQDAMFNKQLDQIHQMSSRFDQPGQEEYSGTIGNLSALDKEYARGKIPESEYLQARMEVARPLINKNWGKHLKNQPGDFVTEGLDRYQVQPDLTLKRVGLDPNATPEALQAYVGSRSGTTPEGIPYFVKPDGEIKFGKAESTQTPGPKDRLQYREAARDLLREQGDYNETQVEELARKWMAVDFGLPMPQLPPSISQSGGAQRSKGEAFSNWIRAAQELAISQGNMPAALRIAQLDQDPDSVMEAQKLPADVQQLLIDAHKAQKSAPQSQGQQRSFMQQPQGQDVQSARQAAYSNAQKSGFSREDVDRAVNTLARMKQYKGFDPAKITDPRIKAAWDRIQKIADAALGRGSQ